jgi:hypothetical protein
MANSKGLYPQARDLIERILANDDQTLYERSQPQSGNQGGQSGVGPDELGEFSKNHIDRDGETRS